MKILATLLAATLCLAHAHAAALLRITEVMSSSGTGGTEDWFEITNVGDSAADLTGYKMDDGSFDFTKAVVLSGVTSIAPGESVIFTEDNAAGAEALKTYWGLASTVQVGYYSGSKVGLSSGGDGVVVFNASGTEVTPRASFGPASAGSSFYWVYDSSGTLLSAANGTISSNGTLGAFSSTGVDIGSPGSAASSLALAFTSSVKKFATTGEVYSSSVTFQKASGSDVATLSLVSGPSWLSLTNVTQSGGVLTGTPSVADAGPQTVVLRLEVAGQTTVEQTGTVTVFPAQPRIVLNEFNAVAPTSVHASSEADLRLGKVEGNGGDWFELVVVGTGFGTTVDMRGWKIQVSQIGSGTRLTDTITLSQDAFWSAVPAGMILTFTEDNSAEGGHDTALNAETHLTTAKWAWSNIWIGDTQLVTSVSGPGLGGISVSKDDTQIAILNAGDGYEFGPCGEGLWRYPEVNDSSCFYLAADPSSGIDPGEVQADARYSALYFGKDPVVPSTFGRPNLTETGIQPFFGVNSPYFASRPYRLAREGQTTYASLDFRQDEDHALSFALQAKGGGAVPAWVTVSATPYYADIDLAPGAGDAGVYEFEMVLTDTENSATTVEPYTVVVLPATSEVILNEFNAVGGSDLLNGGVVPDPTNGDGTDTFFGQVEGNGGDWFELVVVGNGTASTVDMRGWVIQIDDAAGPAFSADDTIVLSQDAYWAAVPAGTILTFTEKNSADGGLDTWINKVNRLGQSGGTAIGSGACAWSNIHIADPVYIDQGLSSFGGGLGVGSNNTQFRILKPGGQVVAGPVGEGIQPTGGIGSTEVLELEVNPTPLVSPYLDPIDAEDPLNFVYDDGNGSTFGSPNTHTGGTLAQDFSAFQRANSAPTFGNSPVRAITEGDAYSFTATTADAEGHPVTVSVLSKPVWLAFAGNVLGGTAPVGSSGNHTIELVATDSLGAATSLKWTLEVAAPVGSTYEGWAGGASATSDTNGDGLTALAEYALGASSPAAGDVIPPTEALVSGQLTLTAVVRVDDPALTVTCESSTTLTSWNPADVSSEAAADQTGVPAGCERRIYSAPLEGSKKFLRLRITLAP